MIMRKNYILKDIKFSFLFKFSFQVVIITNYLVLGGHEASVDKKKVILSIKYGNENNHTNSK